MALDVNRVVVVLHHLGLQALHDLAFLAPGVVLLEHPVLEYLLDVPEFKSAEHQLAVALPRLIEEPLVGEIQDILLRHGAGQRDVRTHLTVNVHAVQR